MTTNISGNWNLTGLENSQTVLELLKWANTSTGELLVGGFLILLWFVLFSSITTAKKRAGTTSNIIPNAAMISSFVTLILGGFLVLTGLISTYILLYFGMIAAVSALYVFIKS